MARKKEKRLEKQVVLLFIFFVVLAAAFFAIFFLGKPKPYFEWNNWTVWRVQLQGTDRIYYSIPAKFVIAGSIYEQNVVLRNDPREIENISINVSKELLRARKLWITIDPYSKIDIFIAAFEIGKFAQTAAISSAYALTYLTQNRSFNQSLNQSLNVADCDNATADERVVLVELSNRTTIYSDGYCIIIEGKSYDELIQAADRLVLEWLNNLRELK